MRRLRTLLSDAREFVRDFSHAARAQGVATWARRRGATDYAVGTADCAPIPVVLLPGILERSTYLAPLGRFLAAQGHPVHAVESLGWNISGLDESVERCLTLLQDRDVQGAVFVAHSKGGLIGKALLTDPRLGDAAVGLVAVATPSGDPISMLALTVPMCLLYEVSIVIGRLRDRAKRRSAAAS